jgi:hypothetical protein
MHVRGEFSRPRALDQIAQLEDERRTANADEPKILRGHAAQLTEGFDSQFPEGGSKGPGQGQRRESQAADPLWHKKSLSGCSQVFELDIMPNSSAYPADFDAL